MSYEIIYDKQFVKLSDGTVIPMILCGSNNTYDVVKNGVERRSRDWWCVRWFSDGLFNPTPELILAKVDEELKKKIDEYTSQEYAERYNNGVKHTEDEIRREYGYYNSVALNGGRCKSMSFTSFRNIFAIGIKNAKTIEELANNDIRLVFKHFHWHDYKYSIAPPSEEYINTEADYFRKRDEYLVWQKECIITRDDNKQEKPSVSLYFAGRDEYISDRIYIIRKLEKQDKPAKQKKEIMVDSYYVLKNDNGYLVKYTARGFKYAYSLSYSCKSFMTEKEANTYKNKLVREKKHKAESWIVTPVNSQKIFRIAA
jgi:hypothetical protein